MTEEQVSKDEHCRSFKGFALTSIHASCTVTLAPAYAMLDGGYFMCAFVLRKGSNGRGVEGKKQSTLENFLLPNDL